MKRIVLLTVIWLVVVNLFALAALNRLNLANDTAYSWMKPEAYFQPKTWNPIPLHARWDSYFLLDVVKAGYHYGNSTGLSNVVFFPLYPSLMRAAGPVVANDYILAGWIISSLALIVAACFLYRIAKEFHPNADPTRAVMLLLIFPTAFFLNAVYTEATFLALMLGSFYFVLKRNFWIAGLLAVFASLTRITGLFLFLPFVWEYILTIRERRKIWWDALALPLPLLGTSLFFLYHKIRFGDFWLFFKEQRLWGRTSETNWEHLSLFSRPATVNVLIDATISLLALAAVYFVVRRLRTSYALYMLTALAIPLASGTLLSMNRFVLMMFPLFLLGATIKNRTVNWAWTLTSTLFFALATLLFVNWYWAG